MYISNRNLRVFIILILTFYFHKTFSQIGYPGKIMGPGFDNNKGVQYLKIERPLKSMNTISHKVTNQRLNYKSDIFADNVEVDLSSLNSGAWDTLASGICIWRLGLYCPNAGSVGIIFEKFQLIPGAKLMIYSPSLREIYGAFTYRNNKTQKLFAVAPIKDDTLIVELQVIKGLNDIGQLVIGNIGLGFPDSDLQKSTNDQWYGRSADCNVDVNCIMDKHIQQQKNSVCRIVYDNVNRCTGTLINNTANDERPLVITAGHCIKTGTSAETAIFFFDYESPYCQGPDGSNKSISGSRLLARSDELDFALVELTDKPPADYTPLYAGWDASTILFSGSYTIHHPLGDVKKITQNIDQVTDGEANFLDSGVYWLVSSYETGTTEKGSSGSALFDTSGHIRGTLTSGGEACSEYIFDYYARFNKSWNYFKDSTNQLEYWLNPLKINTEKLDYYIPNDQNLEFSEELSNIKSNETLVVLKDSNDWGYLTGYNSGGTNEFAELYTVNGSKYIYALKVNVAKINALNNISKIVFKIWEGSNLPGKVLFQKELLLFELTEGIENLIRFDNTVYVDKKFYVGYEIFYNSLSDTFAVYNANPDSRTINTFLIKKGGKWLEVTNNNNSINTSLAITPVVFDYVVDNNRIAGQFPDEDITLYPNPATNRLQVLFKEKKEGTVSYKIFDLRGTVILSGQYESPEPNFSINISGLSRGLYILHVTFPGGKYKLKFVKFE